MGYRIKTVSDLTGIPKNTLIAWERRYGIVAPERRGNQYRSYSDDDLAVLKRLKRLTEEGYKISEAVLIVRRPDLASEGGPSALSDRSESASLEPARRDLLQALLAFSPLRAEEVLQRYASLPYTRLIVELYFPVLRAVGEGWIAGNVSMAQEHYVTAFCRERFMAMLMQLGAVRGTGPHAIFTTFPGDLHELGALGTAVQLAISGWRITYLGPNLPASELHKTSHAVKPDWVCVSMVVSAPEAALSAYIEEVSCALPKRSWLVVGGAGTSGYQGPVPKRVLVTQDWRELMQEPV